MLALLINVVLDQSVFSDDVGHEEGHVHGVGTSEFEVFGLVTFGEVQSPIGSQSDIFTADFLSVIVDFFLTLVFDVIQFHFETIDALELDDHIDGFLAVGVLFLVVDSLVVVPVELVVPADFSDCEGQDVPVDVIADPSILVVSDGRLSSFEESPRPLFLPSVLSSLREHVAVVLGTQSIVFTGLVSLSTQRQSLVHLCLFQVLRDVPLLVLKVHLELQKVTARNGSQQ